MKPGVYNFKSCVVEDTVKGRSFNLTRTPEGGSETPEDLTDATAIFTLRSPNDVVAYTATDGDGLSHNGAGGVVTLDAFEAPSVPGTYKYDLEVNFSDGTRRTYIAGVLPLTQGQTRVGQ